LAAIVLETPSLIADLVDVCVDVDDSDGNWRAAWLLNKVQEENPILLQAYSSRLIDFFIHRYAECSDGLLRCLLRCVIALDYREDLCVPLLDTCTNIYKKQKYGKGLRVNAMKVIGNVVCIYPELAVEFIPEFELLATHDEKSIAAAARNQLKEIKRRQRSKLPH
ncbi:MAG: hypothetical protein ACK5IJ_00620, partial [Mangrovibacterium sp.]